MKSEDVLPPNQLNIFNAPKVPKKQAVNVEVPSVYYQQSSNKLYADYYFIFNKTDCPLKITIFNDGTVYAGCSMLSPQHIANRHIRITIKQWNEAVEQCLEYWKKQKIKN